jgi:uncharacterized protein with HEPN domain
MRSDRERLLDILEAAEKIKRYAAARDKGAFESDELLQVWVVHHLQIIGEAAYRLSQQFRERHPEIPWDQMVGMRHVLVHGYFDIDLDIVWATVQNDLPPVRRAVATILECIEG